LGDGVLQGNDLIHGSEGNDFLDGGGGDDALFGGRDDDLIDAVDDFPPKGKDRVSGGFGNDDIVAHDDVVDNIRCGTGFDTVTHDIGIDVVAADCENRIVVP
jgi:hypothetical protein